MSDAIRKDLITLPKSFVGPVPGNSVFAEVVSLGGDEFRWFIRKGRYDEVTEFHRQAREIADRLALSPAQPDEWRAESGMQRFTCYRFAVPEATHDAFQRNPADEAQFEGIIFTDGTVAIRWRTACRSTSVWSSLEDLLRIHGHPEYDTGIIWHDGPAPDFAREFFAGQAPPPIPEPDKMDDLG